MKALVATSYGGWEVFRIEEVSIPAPGKGQLRLKVLAAAVNYSDLQIAGNFYPGHSAVKPPYVAGREACGVVDAVGPGVEGIREGDRVIALGVLGAFAEYALCHASAASPAPDGVDHTSAAGMLLQDLAAVTAVEACAAVKAGERFLVHAAAGKIGQRIVTLAKHLGAEVFATASRDAKIKVIRALGADHCINYAADDFSEIIRNSTDGRGVDTAFDPVGGKTLRKTLATMRPYGRLVIAGNASNSAATFTHDELLSTYRCSLITMELGTMILQRPDLMSPVHARAEELRATGVFKPTRPEIIALRDGARAMERLAGRETVGGLVLVP